MHGFDWQHLAIKRSKVLFIVFRFNHLHNIWKIMYMTASNFLWADKSYPKYRFLCKCTIKIFNMDWKGPGENAIGVVYCATSQNHAYQCFQLSLSKNTVPKILCDLNKCTMNEFTWFKTDQGKPQSGFMLTSSASDCTFRYLDLWSLVWRIENSILPFSIETNWIWKIPFHYISIIGYLFQLYDYISHIRCGWMLLSNCFSLWER